MNDKEEDSMKKYWIDWILKNELQGFMTFRLKCHGYDN